MSRITIPVPAFNGVAPGSPAVSNLEVGPERTYACFYGRITKNGTLVALADLATDVAYIRLEADGDVIRNITPALLLDFLQVQSLTGLLTNGAAANITSFAIPFALQSRRDVTGEEATGLGTVGVKNLQLVVVFNDPGSSPVYTLTVDADIITNQPKALVQYERWNVDSYTVINGTVNINTTPTNDDLYGILFHSSSITGIKVYRDTKPVFDKTKAQAEALLRANGLGSATANYFPWVQDYTRQFTDRLALIYRDANGKPVGRASSFSFDITASGAATVSCLRRSLRWGFEPGS